MGFSLQQVSICKGDIAILIGLFAPIRTFDVLDWTPVSITKTSIVSVLCMLRLMLPTVAV